MGSNNAACTTMQHTVHKALGLRSCDVIPTTLLTPNVRKKRAERALKLRIRLKGRDTIISDKKIVTKESGVNKCNSH